MKNSNQGGRGCLNFKLLRTFRCVHKHAYALASPLLCNQYILRFAENSTQWTTRCRSVRSLCPQVARRSGFITISLLWNSLFPHLWDRSPLFLFTLLDNNWWNILDFVCLGRNRPVGFSKSKQQQTQLNLSLLSYQEKNFDIRGCSYTNSAKSRLGLGDTLAHTQDQDSACLKTLTLGVTLEAFYQCSSDEVFMGQFHTPFTQEQDQEHHNTVAQFCYSCMQAGHAAVDCPGTNSEDKRSVFKSCSTCCACQTNFLGCWLVVAFENLVGGTRGVTFFCRWPATVTAYKRKLAALGNLVVDVAFALLHSQAQTVVIVVVWEGKELHECWNTYYRKTISSVRKPIAWFQWRVFLIHCKFHSNWSGLSINNYIKLGGLRHQYGAVRCRLSCRLWKCLYDNVSQLQNVVRTPRCFSFNWPPTPSLTRNRSLIPRTRPHVCTMQPTAQAAQHQT